MSAATVPTPRLAADERGLILAAADPADPLPRLVYADWLDDHDRPAEALYLRLAVAVLDPTPISYRDELRAALAEQARLVPAGWRAAFDPGVRFAEFLSLHVVRSSADRIYRSSPTAPRLAQGDFRDWGPVLRKFESPAYLYHLAQTGGQLYLVTRLRVAERLTRDEAGRRFPKVRFPDWGWGEVLVSDDPVPLYPDLPVPPEVAARFEVFTRQGKRIRARLGPDGRVTNGGQLDRLKRLAPASAFLLDALLNGWLAAD